jgi:hypothetical protein
MTRAASALARASAVAAAALAAFLVFSVLAMAAASEAAAAAMSHLPLGNRIRAPFAMLIADPAGDRMIDAKTEEIA